MVSEAYLSVRKPWKFAVWLNDIQNKNFLADHRMGGNCSSGNYYWCFGSWPPKSRPTDEVI